jgi:sterol 3beta-glucosyltransferase
MHIAILAAGTRGDLQPALAIGDELTRRGHSVAVTVNEDLAPWVRRSGLTTMPMAFDVATFLQSPEGQRLLASGRFGALTRAIAERDRAANDSIVSACRQAADGADVVLSTLPMAYRGSAIGTAAGIAACTLLYWPYQPTGDWASPLSPARSLGGVLNVASHRLLYALMWRQNKANVDAMCNTLGIPRYRHRPRVESGPALHAYSAHLATSSGRAANQTVVGSTVLRKDLRERLGEGSVPAVLDTWLSHGEPPVYFGFGSMPVLDPAPLLADVAAITERRGLRGLVAAGSTAYRDADLPDHLYLAADPFDHDQVLPRCRAAVHHGGSGTTAAVLRAGLPSVVLSLFVDQPFWGWRVQQAGAGVTLPFRRLTARRLGAAIDQVLQPSYAESATALGVRLRAENGTGPAADALERLATSTDELENR